MTKTKAKSRILDAVQETAADLHRLSSIAPRAREQSEALCVDPASTDDSARLKKSATC